MPGWDGFAIRERFTQRFGAPVWVDNDVNVMALGEWREGIAAGPRQCRLHQDRDGHRRRASSSDGQLHRGAQGGAGDVGHIQVVDDPAVVCRCGNVGCLEARPAAARSPEATEDGGPTGEPVARGRPRRARDA